MTGVNTFGSSLTAALRSFMTEHGITQTQVGDYLGRSQNYVHGRLTGRNELSADIIGAVAVLAHITPRALMVELTERMSH
ncbi:helix-turn-helix domain-containing protein [Isoptericola aurantiacus]|uniref:helix-turn-helix domain-containing protein n=1 Tax=Isoptericola aurantiacus TaxID=3377839 RepID=UPI003839D0AA